MSSETQTNSKCEGCLYRAGARWHNELNVQIKIIELGAEPTLSQRLSAAHYIAARNIADVGVSTIRCLMWPKNEFTNNDVVNFAAWLLANAQSAVLRALPQHEIDTLSTNLNKRLSFVCDYEPPGDTTHDQEK